jgi:plastocyanin
MKMQMLRRAWSASLVLTGLTGAVGALAGCGYDAGTANDARTIDADPYRLNGCVRADAVDLTAAAADRRIEQIGISYMPECIRIRVGQSVTWNADFVAHPLSSGSPTGGPQPGSPITETITGSTKTFTFPAEGVFGFWCEEHGAAMMGAVYVEP